MTGSRTVPNVDSVTISVGRQKTVDRLPDLFLAAFSICLFCFCLRENISFAT